MRVRYSRSYRTYPHKNKGGAAGGPPRGGTAQTTQARNRASRYTPPPPGETTEPERRGGGGGEGGRGKDRDRAERGGREEGGERGVLVLRRPWPHSIAGAQRTCHQQRYPESIHRRPGHGNTPPAAGRVAAAASGTSHPPRGVTYGHTVGATSTPPARTSSPSRPSTAFVVTRGRRGQQQTPSQNVGRKKGATLAQPSLRAASGQTTRPTAISLLRHIVAA